MRTLLMPVFCALVLNAQVLPSPDPTIKKIENVCPPEEAQELGLECSEGDPCPVYLELSDAWDSGASIVVTGNLHTERTTMFGILLASTDSGKTWTEPAKRFTSSVLHEIQFFDAQHGWISGNLLDPLPRAPFFLLTADGGQSWHRVSLPGDSEFGAIERFWFDSASRGEAAVDRSQGAAERHELYSTSDGGESWTVKSSKYQASDLPAAAEQNWRVAAGKESYEVQRRTASTWETLARFPILAGECK